jgi:hypothetical protein
VYWTGGETTGRWEKERKVTRKEGPYSKPKSSIVLELKAHYE